ncbi:MAG TPA: lysylphosphatidylglycerol synthase transmembrane domain-containing protein [Thermoguttaceae bacterium]|nr:lysylphosphatidylglycerol synthase transmembrane domain-containing protein [Thermoguttaceae bacterium]
MTRDPSSRRKWLRRAIKLLIAAAVLWWVHGTLYDGWIELKKHDRGQWQWQPGWLAVAGGLYLLGLLPFCLFWHRVLKTLGQQARLAETIRAYYIGHLGKYVPGKAMVVVIRAGLIRSHRVATGVAAVSVLLETLTMMAVGAFVAAAYLALFFHEKPLWSWAAGGLMVVSLVPTLPSVFRRLVRLAGVGKSDPQTAEKIGRFGFKTLLLGWLLSLIGWAILGLSYWATLRAMGIEGLDPVGHLPRYVAGVALAVVAGFLLLVLPAGLGVREAFLIELTLPYLKELGRGFEDPAAWASAVAVAAAVLLRLVWTVSESLISGILWFCKPRPRPGDPL